MVTALEFKSEYDLGISQTGKFYVDKENNVIESIKNVPIVIENNIYNLDYIKSNMNKLKYSCHVAFIDIDKANVEFIKSLNKMGVAVFLRMTINENNMEIVMDLNDETVPYDVRGCIDRYILVDNTKSMTFDKLLKIKEFVGETLGVSVDDIGVCGSPFSFGDNACLCAVWARRIMAKYISNTEVALPSANHECMEECGCIRKVVITDNICAPKSNKSTNSSGDRVREVKGVNNIRGLF